MDDERESLYKARQKRYDDVIALALPDRVPVTAAFYFFPAGTTATLSKTSCTIRRPSSTSM